MTVKYYLTLNDLTPAPDDYRAVVQVNDTKNLEYLINKMISRGSTVTKAEALSTIEEYYVALNETLEEGHGINTPVYSIAPKIKGVFYKDDRFDQSKHKLNLRLIANDRLKNALRNMKLEKVATPQRVAYIKEYEDAASSTVNSVLTPGETACIKGKMLRFDQTDPRQGIFFQAQNGNEFKAKTILRNKPGEIIFTVPAALKKGDYNLQVKKVRKEGGAIETATLATTLTVQ